ncbi:glycosyltransferase family 2 protein [Longirhabdus pacifica]|uniref:glycosyltransferase family 2 protein n=1 Tax=Longirhabdus pacifica TaxID=2305227 RepID=UPI001008F386|nr:glycosyltransferase [Longirhabdus pacifica]
MEMKQPDLVSIVIPIYNGEKYIEKTVNSVLKQTYPNLELLCIIDGSTDESHNLLKSINDPRLQIILQENHGCTATRNKGLHMAQGRWVMFLDQDDLLHEQCIETCVDYMQQHETLQGLVMNGVIIDEQDQVIRKMYKLFKPNLKWDAVALKNQIYTTSQLFVYRDVLCKLNGFDEHLQGFGADDWDLLLRLIKQAQLIFLDESFIYYRLHENNHSKQLDTMLKSEMDVIKKNSGRYPQLQKSYRYMYYAYKNISIAGNKKVSYTSMLKAIHSYIGILFYPRFYFFFGAIVMRSLKKL